MTAEALAAELRVNWLRPARPEELAAVEDAQDMSKSRTDVLVRTFRIDWTRGHLVRTRAHQWLSDDFISAAAEAIKARHAALLEDARAASPRIPTFVRPVRVFDSFFFTQLMRVGSDHRPRGYSYENVANHMRVSRRPVVYDDVRAMRCIIVPVNIESRHWVVAALFPAERRVEYFDSMEDGRGTHRRFIGENLVRWYADEVQHRGFVDDAAAERAAWTVTPKERAQHVPQQADESSCGVFSIVAMDYLALGLEGHLNLTQANMPAVRRNLALRVLGRHPWGPNSVRV